MHDFKIHLLNWLTSFFCPSIYFNFFYLVFLSFQPIAPRLSEGSTHHVVFISHPNDQYWVTDVINRLQTPALGFKCWSQDKNQEQLAKNNNNQDCSDSRTSTNGMIVNPLKTVIVISKDFINDIWLNNSNNGSMQQSVFAGCDFSPLNTDLIIMIMDDCDVPKALMKFVCIEVKKQMNWWTKLIGQLCSIGKN